MATHGRSSVFTAFSKMRVSDKFDSDEGSTEERQQERKEKQKQRKKSRGKKKSSDSAQLKDLAFVSASKSRKNKSKRKKCKTGANALPHSPSGSSIEEAPTTKCKGDEVEDVIPREGTLADNTGSTLQQQKTDAFCGVKKKLQLAYQLPPTKVTRSIKQEQQQNEAPDPVQPVFRSAPSGLQSSSETELGAVYTPSHITITRVDGQMERTVSVTEVLDQLLRFTQQNTQLHMVQEQLGLANRNLQDQLQRSGEIISGLQNEVTMFRQMCLNLQAEVSQLRSNTAVQNIPDAGINPQSQHHHRPPPGMS